MTTSKNPIDPASKLIVRGVHLDLTEALRQAVATKAERLLRHNDYIVRIRIDLELDKTKDVNHKFIAKGHIEIGGPDLIASVASEDCYKSIDLLVDKLDRLLERRHGIRKDKRNHPHATDIASELPKT